MKYRMTDTGYAEFTANRKAYTATTVVAKLMSILSTRVGYTLDSLTSQVKLDLRLKKTPDGEIISALNELRDQNYLEVGQ